MTRVCLASGSKLGENIKDYGCEREADMKLLPPILCHALLALNHMSVYVSQSVHLLFTKPKHDTEAIPCDQSSLSVKLVHVGGMVTLAIHHDCAAALCQTSAWVHQASVCSFTLESKFCTSCTPFILI